MAISTLNITSGPYLGTGSTTVYPYDFPITGTSEIVVVETTDTGVESVLVLGTHFSVSGVGQEAGGNVTRLAGPLPLNYTWYMRSNYVADQETDFQSQGAFFPDIHESAFDKLTILHQQVVDRIERTIKLSDTQDIGAVDLTLPNITNRALKYLSFDAAGNIVMDIQPTADAIAAAISAEAAQAAAEAAQAASEAAATTAAVDAIAASAALIAADVAAADGSATSAANSASAASSSAASATSSANASAANAVSTAADAVQTNLDKISASSSATSAGSSAATATTKANEASTSATNSATSASNSATSASAALTSANNSATSASASAGSATASSNSAAAAAASYDSFDDRYLGPKSSAPTVDNDGNALLTGAIYWSTPETAMKVYTGSLWKLVTTVVEGVYDVTEYTNIATQTTLTIAYDVGLVQVLYNGVQLNLGDFTATNSTSIVLAVAVADNADVITVIRWGAVTTSTFLGTAATADVQTSSTDTTANALMAVGAFGLGTDLAPIVTSQDCNLITISGDYYGSSGNTANMPVSSTSFQITHSVGQTSDFATQTAIAYGAGVGTNVNKVYFRHKDSGVWESWNEVITANAAGNVGIGTISPTAPLHTVSSENLVAKFSSSDVTSGIRIEDTTTSYDFYVDSGNLRINNTAGSEKMRLDSAGNLLVGTTSVDPYDFTSGGGTSIQASGLFSSARDGGTVGAFNRTTSDGDIVQFRKGGTTVGSIGSESGSLLITVPTNGGSLIFAGDTGGTETRIAMSNATGQESFRPYNSYSDAKYDLGASGRRFKDLYLSGGVYLGGTAAANKLDDYEEGTWNPVMSTGYGSYPGTAGWTTVGKYTKIGNMVTCRATYTNTSTASILLDDRFLVTGIPFAASTLTAIEQAGSLWVYAAIGGGANAFGSVSTNGSQVWHYITHIDGAVNYTKTISVQFTYIAA